MSSKLVATDCNAGIVKDPLLLFHAVTVALARAGYEQYTAHIAVTDFIHIRVFFSDAPDELGQLTLEATPSCVITITTLTYPAKAALLQDILTEQLRLKNCL